MYGELFKLLAHVDLVTVNYRAPAPALSDLIGGQIDVMFDSLVSSIEHVRAGEVRALAVTSATGLELLPNVPPAGDFVPGYEATSWYGGIGAPRNTPPFVRVCPYLPFSARICLNQHHWLANRMREKGIGFKQLANAFLKCAAPNRLQELANSLSPKDLVTCGQKWLAHLTPFFTAREREHAGCQHRLFFSQVEYCDNLIFRRRAALDNLGQRLLDANRTIGQPDKITVIFGRKVTKQYRGKLQTEIEDMNLPNPVIRSHYRNGFIKQYVRDHLILRTEASSNNVKDYGVKKAVENLPVLQKALSAINDTYLNVQQDILETFVDRGQLRKLAEPTITSTGKRIPGLKLDHPRQLALMHALVRFAHIAAGNTFTTAEIHPAVIEALGCAPERYTLASLRYDLSKLRAKGLVAKLPNSRRYQLLPQGYSICLLFLKLFERVYAPLTAGLLSPIKADARLQSQRRSQLDRLYQRGIDDLDTLVRAVGLKAASRHPQTRTKFTLHAR